MIEYTQNAFSNPKVVKAFDWSVFAGGMVSLVFAIAMTIMGDGETQNAGAHLNGETLASL
ncbi:MULTISPECIES: hypothetical protein [Falsihalocynthiibacter]|uniref:Uncharacterized protein n=1 Tax=Falsihalocynthiibacter arcticus TaxID=1579316 RepID=A0A126UWC7_9RHOB|nr:hypothetical protein [Falsihalocynthiibacter arcticus]AML50045.1 hypothetical protein RC74_01000 [Falsihalocynthiibacter arcticus]